MQDSIKKNKKLGDKVCHPELVSGSTDAETSSA